MSDLDPTIYDVGTPAEELAELKREHSLAGRLTKLANHLENLDSESGEAKLMNEAVAFIEPRQFECAARPWEKRDPPSECDWPGCGCDPYARKVLDAIDEQGYTWVTKHGAE